MYCFLVTHRTEAAPQFTQFCWIRYWRLPRVTLYFEPFEAVSFRSEGPCALVRILRASAVVPGVKVRIGRGLFQFMRNDAGHAVSTGITVRACALRLAG